MLKKLLFLTLIIIHCQAGYTFLQNITTCSSPMAIDFTYDGQYAICSETNFAFIFENKGASGFVYMMNMSLAGTFCYPQIAKVTNPGGQENIYISVLWGGKYMLYLLDVAARSTSLVIQTAYLSVTTSYMHRLIEHGPYWYFSGNGILYVYSNTGGTNYTQLTTLSYTLNMNGAIPAFSCSVDGIYLAMMNNYYYVNLYRLSGSSLTLITGKDSGVSAVSKNGYWATYPFGQNTMNIYKITGNTVNLFQTLQGCDCNYFFD